jgi:hypothetical protein
MPRGKSDRSIRIVRAAQEILREIQPASVRAVCYRLFVQGLIPNMSKASTNAVGTQLVWARKQRYIPWAWVVDETREAEITASWEEPEQFADTMVRAYRRDAWSLQDYRVEVWSEKGTVRGTLRPVLDELGVTFRVMHGYASATAIHEVAREAAALPADKRFIVLYVGDWDPSGLHMSAVDLPSRLADEGVHVRIQRIALSATDGDALPSFPLESKRGDPRHNWYASQFGPRCWELDALPPNVLRERVYDAISGYIDPERWYRCLNTERAERDSLVAILNNWNAISA